MKKKTTMTPRKKNIKKKKMKKDKNKIPKKLII